MTPARILVVHDEPALGRLLVRLLQEGGYEVAAAPDGRLAWADALASGDPFDLLVTNRFVPELTGSEVLALMAGAYPGAPILHLDMLQHAWAGDCAGQAAYTPFCRDLFLAEVEHALTGAGAAPV